MIRGAAFPQRGAAAAEPIHFDFDHSVGVAAAPGIPKESPLALPKVILPGFPKVSLPGIPKESPLAFPIVTLLGLPMAESTR